MDSLIRDIRFGLRGLAKHPGFTAVAVLTLALGIGANSAIFSVVNAVVLRPLIFPQQEQVVRLGEASRGDADPQRGSTSLPDFNDLRSQSQSLAYVALHLNSGALLDGPEGESERVVGANVSPEYFSVLGVAPLLGRTFTPEENRPDSGVVVISHGLWQRHFNSRADVIGQELRLSGSGVKVIGVMPAGFEYPFRLEHQDFWQPVLERPIPGQENRDNRSFRVVGRMKAGVTLASLRVELDAISRRIEQENPKTNTHVVFGGAAVLDDLTRDSKPALFVLLGAVTFVLLIACANVANFMLARATSRKREIALRLALGASRWQIIRQLLVESMLLGIIGGALGLFTAVWGTRLLVGMGSTNIPRLDQIGLDWRVVGFTLVISVITGIAFGLIPALQSSSPKITGWLKDGGRNTANGPGRNLARNALVVTEVALSLVLLVGAGLLLKSFVRLLGTDPGFEGTPVVTFDIPLSRRRYDTEEKQVRFFKELEEKTQAIPGVTAVGVVNNVVLGNSGDTVTFNIAGRAPFAPGTEPESNYTVVSPGYFDAMKIPLRRGRLFTEQDSKQSTPVALVSESLVKKVFPNENPIGLRLSLDTTTPPIEIIGVVGDARRSSLEQRADPEFYLPFAQAPNRRMNLVVRAANTGSISPSVRAALASLDREQTIWQTRKVADLLSDSVSQRRFNLMLLAVFASIALVLALLGIYGVMTYSVRQTTKEIGIRMALGAQMSDVLRMVVGNGMTLAAIGVVLGLVGAFALTRLMSSLLFEVTPTDWSTYAIVAMSLQAVALFACYIPARRAARVDPLIALRCE